MNTAPPALRIVPDVPLPAYDDTHGAQRRRTDADMANVDRDLRTPQDVLRAKAEANRRAMDNDLALADHVVLVVVLLIFFGLCAACLWRAWPAYRWGM